MASHEEMFFSAAIQYYIAGRYAAFASLNPVVGNLLHHAVEMCLKGALAKRGKSLNDLKNLWHNLPRIWAEFKAQTQDPSLDQFDAVISSLHDFEELRYPDLIVQRGMQSTVNLGKRASSRAPVGAAAAGATYELYLGDIDELVGKVFTVASVNPKFFTSGLTKHAKEYLNKKNEASALCAPVIEQRDDRPNGRLMYTIGVVLLGIIVASAALLATYLFIQSS